jgi:hypothetical protein
MQHCQQCGCALAANIQFCSNCGAQLPSQVIPPAQASLPSLARLPSQRLPSQVGHISQNAVTNATASFIGVGKPYRAANFNQSKTLFIVIGISFASIIIAILALILDWYHVEAQMRFSGEEVRMEMDDSLSEREIFMKDMKTGEKEFETQDNDVLEEEYPDTVDTKAMSKIFVILSLVLCSVVSLMGLIAIFTGRGVMAAVTIVAIITVLCSFLSAFLFMMIWNPYDDGDDSKEEEDVGCADEMNAEGNFFYGTAEGNCTIDGVDVEMEMTIFAGAGFWMMVFHFVMMLIASIGFAKQCKNKYSNLMVF